jgi:hypothetical protein
MLEECRLSFNIERGVNIWNAKKDIVAAVNGYLYITSESLFALW